MAPGRSARYVADPDQVVHTEPYTPQTGHSVEELVAYIQDEYSRLNTQETSPENE